MCKMSFAIPGPHDRFPDRGKETERNGHHTNKENHAVGWESHTFIVFKVNIDNGKG